MDFDFAVPTHDSPEARRLRETHRLRFFCLRCGFPFGVSWIVPGRSGIAMPHELRFTVEALDGAEFNVRALCEHCWLVLRPEGRWPYVGYRIQGGMQLFWEVWLAALEAVCDDGPTYSPGGWVGPGGAGR